MTIIVMLSSLQAASTLGDDIQSEITPTSGRKITGCPESMPPPVVDGIRRGNWTITCDVNVTKDRIQIAGNILIDFGGSLNVLEGATIIQEKDDDGPYGFTIYNQASLTVEDSTLRLDEMHVLGSGSVFIRESNINVRGRLSASGGLFELTDSIFSVLPDNYGLSPDVEMNMTAQGVFIRNSIIQVRGLNAMAGNSSTPPDKGGDARGSLIGHIVTNLTMTIQGGFGGRASNQTSGNGHPGGKGGDTDLTLDLEKVSNLHVVMNGGNGGTGGNGAENLGTIPGGHGGNGGEGGGSESTLLSLGYDLEELDILVKGGSGGPGGDGGGSMGGGGGHGADGAAGGDAELHLEGTKVELKSSRLRAEGGNGGGSGTYGKDYEGGANGQPGTSGEGGTAIIDIEVYDDLTLEDTDLEVDAGHGASGSLGWQFGGDGGFGGNATLSIFSGGNLTFGPGPYSITRPIISVKGGDAGPGGQYTGGNEVEYMGRTGRSGGAFIDIDCLGVAILSSTDLTVSAGEPGDGRNPQNMDRIGANKLLLSAARYTVENSTSNLPFEGLRSPGSGLLRNVTVQGGEAALVWAWESDAKVEIWWYLDVNFTPMLDDQMADVWVTEGDNPDSLVDTCELRGGWDTCRMLLRGEVVDSSGHYLDNYTVEVMTDDQVQSSRLSFYLRGNKHVTLNPGGNFYAPHINLSYPEDGATFTVEDLATGMVKILGMAWEDIKDPPNWITDVEIELTNWKTKEVRRYDKTSGVNVTPMSASVSMWELHWWLDEKIGYLPLWSSGSYRLCVKAYDGTVWSDDDDPRRDGTSHCINIAIFQMEGKKPVVPVPDDFPEQVYGMIPVDGDYVQVEFNTSIIQELGDTGTYYRFDWDFDLDGKVDWTYFPINGSFPPGALKIFTDTGIFTARLFLIDINGDTTTIDTQVIIYKEVESEPAPVEMPTFCLPTTAVFIILVIGLYIGMMFVETFRFFMLTRIFLPLHMSLKKELEKEDTIRRKISDYLAEKPGRFFGKVQRDLDLSGLHLVRELLYLEDLGDATHKRDGYRIRLLSTRKKVLKKRGLRIYEKRILKALIKSPWQTPYAIAKQMGRTEVFVERQLRRLEKKDLIIIRYDEKEGPLYRAKIPTKKKRTYKRKKRRKVLRPSPTPAPEAEPEPEPGPRKKVMRPRRRVKRE